MATTLGELHDRLHERARRARRYAALARAREGAFMGSPAEHYDGQRTAFLIAAAEVHELMEKADA